MPISSQNPSRLRMLAVGLTTIAISALFIGMIWNFLIALFLAAIFSAMASPLYEKVLSILGGRKGIAAATTLLILFICVLVPIIALVYLAAIQANELTTNIASFVQRVDVEGLQFNFPEWMPFGQELQRTGTITASKVGELAGSIAGFFVSAVSGVTKGTASFFLSLFILIYAMVFFLQEQTNVLAQLMHYSGLSPASQKRLIERTISISRATIKGTLVIGVVQGALGGIGFAVTGIPGAAFWGAVIAVVSIIPGIGPPLILIPGVIYLYATGEIAYAIGLALWTGLVVTTIDNLLRPALVGRDTQMHDLLILVSTLGGLAMFGAVGLIIGPVLAGLFVTIWEISRETFGDI